MNRDDALVVGVDYGTLSGRALVVRVRDGAELGSAVHEYPHAVMERTLTAGPAVAGGTPVALAPDWALQVPADYEESLAASAVEKQRIGERAASLVTSGMSVVLDVGATTTAIARALAARTDLEQVAVITNGLKVALELEGAMPDAVSYTHLTLPTIYSV